VVGRGLLGFVPGFVKIDQALKGESRARAFLGLRLFQAFVAGEQE
jgi:hypothetical protein